MADVVISYAHEERDKAQHLAEVLKKFGFVVWWDRNLYAGEDFSAKIEQKIRQSTAVIVMWSVNSVKSRWVLGEASLADELDKLITVKVDECNLPINYRNLH
ncbi:MAG: toll/interleukin-1 receptor domain-containing protein, partial [Gammaproteobacteria bacterium]|nr:toll/interleukin-1 receptor domain-containing protein [Gammaproteobacteria bacterium]